MLSQLSVNTAPPPFDSLRVQVEEDTNIAVYYIYTEGAFPVQRLKEIIAFSLIEDAAAAGNAMKRRRTERRASDSSEHWRKACGCSAQLLDFVFIEEIASDMELWDVLLVKIPKLLKQYRVSWLLSLFHSEPFAEQPIGGAANWCHRVDRLNVWWWWWWW
eukprot:GHVS01105507.1.p2 GENE.GHVS01105507.1~~GHVS01105507.1.p2  ORF type:complete len:160 (+),score=29.09 GHVS01105507.1:694-1173(+)